MKSPKIQTTKNSIWLKTMINYNPKIMIKFKFIKRVTVSQDNPHLQNLLEPTKETLSRRFSSSDN